MARSQLLVLLVAVFAYYATAQSCTTPDSQLYIFPYSSSAGGFVNQPMTQLNINATDRFDYLTNYTWVVTSIPAGLQYTVTDDKMGIFITGTPARAGTFTMNVILLYWDNSANKQSCSTQPVNFQFLCQVPITVSPSSSSAIQGTALSPAGVQFTASGGAGSGYVFSSNINPMNGVNLTSTGALTGSWSAPSTFNFFLTVVDSGNCRAVITYSVNVVCPTISISPSDTLPSGVTTTFYNSSLTSSGGRSPYTYLVTDGSIPTDFILSTNGFLYGTPAGATTATFTVRTTDANNCQATAELSLDLICPTINLSSISGSNLVDKPYNSTVTASGGSGPYTYAVNDIITKRSIQATPLPPGLELNPNTGLISGSPTATGSYEFEIVATDAKGCTASDIYVIEVSCGTLAIGNITTTGTAAGSYSATLSTTGGTAPYVYDLDAGSYPPSLLLTEQGILSGTLTKNGTYVFNVIVTDVRDCQAIKQFTLDIGCPTITTTTLTRNAQATKSYISVLQVDDGIDPYTIINVEGLPAGIEYDDRNFNFFGTPTETGYFNVSVTIADDNGCTNHFFMPLNVTCATFSFSGVANVGNVDVEYESDFGVVSGSVGTISYSVISGTLPDGLELDTSGMLSGTPTKAGTFTFQIEATDENGCTGVYTQSLLVGCSASTLSVDSTLESGQTGVFYTDSFSASGSTHLPYTYTLSSLYYPSGVQKQVSGGLSGWVPCYSGSYDEALSDGFMAELAEFCGSSNYMMLACGEAESGTFYNLAAGETNVILSEGISTSNGVDWYFTSEAWGFAPENSTLELDSCDVLEGDLRTCWNLNSEGGGGYRCGDATNLNGEQWQRYVFISYYRGGSAIEEYELLGNGTLLGLPTISGDQDFIVTVTDAAGCSASQAGVLKIDCGRFYVEPLADAQVTIFYSQNLSISGGSGSYIASIEGLPSGLEYDNETNVLSGVPTTNGEFEITIAISDLINPCTYIVETTILVLCPPNHLSDIPPIAQVGTTYLAKIDYQNMMPPLYFNVESGMLPYGVSLYRDGTIEGVPSLPGDYSFFIRLIQDAPNGCSDGRLYHISVVCGPIDISDISNSYMLGDTVDQSFASSNGIQEYNYTLGSGQLPDGLTLELDGHLSGTVTKAGFFRFSVLVQDTYGCVGQRYFVVAITCTDPMALGALPTVAMAGEQVSDAPILLGGVAPYTFEVLLGALPDGISLNASSGQISGTVTTVGVFVFQLGVRDSRGCVATEVYTFNVVAPPTSQPPVEAPVAVPVTVAPVSAGNVPTSPPAATPAEGPAVSGQSSIRPAAMFAFVLGLIVFISL